MPTAWIQNQSTPGLKEFGPQDNGSSIAALLIYVAITMEVNDRDAELAVANDTALLTYADFSKVTGLSRAMISRGIQRLVDTGLIEKATNGRNNVFKLVGNSATWGKLPKSYLINNCLLDKLTHRSRNELDALKMYLLFIAFRHNQWNFALISYPKIAQYTGVQEFRIRSGLSLLVNLSLIQIDRSREIQGKKGNPPSQYRICGIDPRRHMGTQKAESMLDDGMHET